MAMKYKTVKEVANDWGITERRVITYCSEGRILGAQRFGWSWAIPVDAKKPEDPRKKTKKRENYTSSRTEILLSRPEIIIERCWSMPNKQTFSIPPIRALILEEMTEGLWIDPFAGSNKLADITNDLNPDFDTDYHLDALDFLKQFENNSVDGVLYDPPYSPRQVSECYNNFGYNVTWDTTKASFWGNHKREISRIVKKHGKVITFGWNSGGIGMKHGFTITRILLVPHGGWHNDTICTVETKGDLSVAMNKNIEIEMSKRQELTDNDKKLIKKLNSLPFDFWDFKNADTKEMTHGLHSYPAIMVYPISRNIIQIVKEIMPISSFLDPFVGSGTTLVEGMLAGIENLYGNDLNPLAIFLSETKTTLFNVNELKQEVTQIVRSIETELESFATIIEGVNNYVTVERGFELAHQKGWGSDAPQILRDYLRIKESNLDIPDFKNIGYWFKPDVILSLQIIKKNIEECNSPLVKQFLWIIFSDVVRTVSNRRSGEFKMFRRPVNKIASYSPNVYNEFLTKTNSNLKSIQDFVEEVEARGVKPKIRISRSDARELDYVPDNSIELLITSPPYGDSRTTVAYGEFSRLSLQWLNLEDIDSDEILAIDKSLMGGEKYRNGFEMNLQSSTLRAALAKIAAKDIERAGDVFSFYQDLDKTIKTTADKMKSGCYQFWVVGNRTVKLEKLLTDQIIIELGEQYGLVHIHTIDRNIPNKVMPSLNSPTNAPGKKVTTMTNEHIVVLKKA